MVMKVGMTLLAHGNHVFRHVFATTAPCFDMMKAVSIFSACLARDARIFSFIIVLFHFAPFNLGRL